MRTLLIIALLAPSAQGVEYFGNVYSTRSDNQATFRMQIDPGPLVYVNHLTIFGALSWTVEEFAANLAGPTEVTDSLGMVNYLEFGVVDYSGVDYLAITGLPDLNPILVPLGQVPEPDAVVLALWGFVVIALRRRRNRC